MAREETRALTMDEINRALEDRLAAMLHAEAEALDPGLPSFLCAHVTVSGATLSSERSLMLGNDHVLLLSTLANPAFDYAALGHVHRHQVLTRNPPVVYAGSLLRVDFSEEDDVKGFCVVDLDQAAPRGERVRSVEFVPVDARPMRTVEADAAAGQDPTEAALTAIRRAQGVEGAIVRLRVSMDAADAGAFRESAIREALAHAHVGGEHRAARPQSAPHAARRGRWRQPVAGGGAAALPGRARRRRRARGDAGGARRSPACKRSARPPGSSAAARAGGRRSGAGRAGAPSGAPP